MSDSRTQAAPGMAQATQNFEVELPGGGKLHLLSIDEVELWETTRDRYIGDYRLTAQSEKILVGALLSQSLIMFRAQMRMTGMEEVLDANGIPTGQYRSTRPSGSEVSAAQSTITKAAEEIRKLEIQLGIDKKTRDAGGQHDVATYIQGGLKAAAREYGIHLSNRYKLYEAVVVETRSKLRMLRQLDSEDLTEMQLTPDTFMEWLWNELALLEDADKKYAHEKGRMFVGRVR